MRQHASTLRSTEPTPRSDGGSAHAIPDNSRQKIYWSFNWPDDLDDKIVENDAPNGTGQGALASGDTVTSIVDQALKLGAEKQIEGRINPLDMRDAGITLSLWIADAAPFPCVRLTQIVDDVLTGESSEEGTSFQSMRFDALAIAEESDRLSVTVARPNASPDDGSNDGKAAEKRYTVELHGALSDGKGWHHVAVLWDGGVSDAVDNLVVLVDGQSFAATSPTGTTQVAGAALNASEDYYPNGGESVPASRFIVSASGDTSIDEVRLIAGIASAELIRALGASRESSGSPLIVWNGGASDPYDNMSPIPGPMSAGLSAVCKGDVTLKSGAYVLDGSSFLESAPHDLFIDHAVTVQGWFKPTALEGRVPLFDVDLGVPSTVDNLEFRSRQGLTVTYDADSEELAVNVIASDIARHDVSTAAELNTAMNAILANTIANQKFRIVITENIKLTASLPSLVGSEFSASDKRLAPGTQVTLESEGSPPKYISGQGDVQILVIDADDAVIYLRNLELREGKAEGAPGSGGGGAGLGAGGALFIAGGEVNMDGVRFTDNVAKGGEFGSVAEYGSGGDNGTEKDERGDDGDDGGDGGRPNWSGDTVYYSAIGEAGAGGEGGNGAYSMNGEGSAYSGSSGTDGDFGYGGGQGGGGQGGSSSEQADRGGSGGSGGDGGFGAGGGGGGGGGGHETEYDSSGGSGGEGGEHGGSGEGGGTNEGSESGYSGGHGGNGAGLGGAIFIADASSLTGSKPPRVRIAGSCVFTDNRALAGDEATARGAAIFFESGSYYNNSSDTSSPFPPQGIGEFPSPTADQAQTITYRYAAPGFAGDWHHVAVGFVNGDVPRGAMDGIPLARADENGAIEVNGDSGFAPSGSAIVRWGHAAGVRGGFVGEVCGLKLFDRGLSGGEVFDDAAAGALQRLIVQLDQGQDTRDGADYLYHASAPVYFNTAWITLEKGGSAALVDGPAGKTWSDLRAGLGDGVVLELVGTGDGDTAGYTADTRLSGYTPEELSDALRGALPGGLSAADMFVSAPGLSDPEGFDEADLAAEYELDPSTEPATLRFGRALINAGLTDSLNVVPLTRMNASEDQIEIKQDDGPWVLYEDINEEHPVLLDYVYRDVSIISIVCAGMGIYDLKGKFKKARPYAYIDKNFEACTPTFRQLPFDMTAEDAGAKMGKSTSTSDKARGKSADVYDVFDGTGSKGLKLYIKDADFLTPGMKTTKSGVKLSTDLLVGVALGSGASLLDDFNKHSNTGNPLFDGGKNRLYKQSARKNAKYVLKNYSLPVLGGLYTIGSAVQLFKTGNPLDIAKGSLSLISGLILPLVETTMVLLAELEICAAAGPMAPFVALAAVVIDTVLCISALIRKAVQRHKMTQKAAEFAADGYSELIADLKDSLGNVEDLFVSGRFSDTQADDATTTDKLTGVTSWLYQALASSCRSSNQDMKQLLSALTDQDKEMVVQAFIQALLSGELSHAVQSSTQGKFEDIYEAWTSEESGTNRVVDIDLISDAGIWFEDDNLVECMQQFVGERLDDGGTQEDETATFTAGEALALDGASIASYPRNIAVYGTDADGLREEIRTGKGDNTVLLGVGEFHVEMTEGNNTVYLGHAFRDVEDANDQNKYYLHAGDIEDTNIGLQLKKDSDTLIIDGAAHVNLTYMADKNMAGGKAKQAVFFQGGESGVPLLVSGFENVYGSPEDDTLVSNANKCTTLTANSGDNILVTGFGAASETGAKNLINQMKGGSGNDKIYGSHAGGQGYNLLSGGEGNNILIADRGVNVLQCSTGSDVLVAAIHPDKTTDNIFCFGFGSGQHRIEKGLHAFEVSCTADGAYTNGVRFEYGDPDRYTYPGDAPVIRSPDQVRDILQFGEGVFADNVRASVQPDPAGHAEPNTGTAITGEVTFSLIVDDTRVFDALIGDDLDRPNLQTGDSITIKGNWSGDDNLNHRVRMLRFGDGSSLEIARIDRWETSGTVHPDAVVLEGATFFQGFSGDDTITSTGGGNVILPGSGRNRIDVSGAGDQVMITRNPLRRDTITIGAGGADLTVVLDGSIRLRDLGLALSGSDLTLTIGSGGTLCGATQTVTINGAMGKLRLRFATGFTLDLTALALREVLRGDNDDKTLTASGPAILAGGFGHDTLAGGPTGPSVLIGGAGDDTLKGSGDNSDDLYILEDRGGMETLVGAGDYPIDVVQNKVVLMVSADADISVKAALSRDDIWFATSETLAGLPEGFDRQDVPEELARLGAGELLVWIRGQNNGAVIKDWAKWDESNRLVVTNAYEGAFAISKGGIAALTAIMDRYTDAETKTYSPWHPDLGDEASTLALNKELSEAILAAWSATSSVFRPGTAASRAAPVAPARREAGRSFEQHAPGERHSRGHHVEPARHGHPVEPGQHGHHGKPGEGSRK